jgi:F-box interacting protein
MAKELPEDLVKQILVWLPIVSLLRFKCVCKSWYALITHQSFITKHLQHNNNNRNILLKMRDKITKDYVVSTLSYETLQLSHTQPAPPSVFAIDKSICIVGSCNGIVCLQDMSLHNFKVVIWNPATKETKIVLKSNLSRFPNVIDCIGFGFDAKTNDYKIINLLCPVHDFNSIPSEMIIQSEVYSLSADSWRQGDSPMCCTFDPYICGLNTYVNGMASWEARVDGWEGVLSFDMSNEVFLKTWLPDVLMVDGLNSWRHFFLLNESIAMAVTILVADGPDGAWKGEMWESCFDIWLLLEVGVKDSWTKLFTIGPFKEIERPLGFWKNETMFLVKWDKQLVLYDPMTKEMSNLQIGYRVTRRTSLFTYMETLVSIKHLKSKTDVDNDHLSISVPSVFQAA